MQLNTRILLHEILQEYDKATLLMDKIVLLFDRQLMEIKEFRFVNLYLGFLYSYIGFCQRADKINKMPEIFNKYTSFFDSKLTQLGNKDKCFII